MRRARLPQIPTDSRPPTSFGPYPGQEPNAAPRGTAYAGSPKRRGAQQSVLDIAAPQQSSRTLGGVLPVHGIDPVPRELERFARIWVPGAGPVNMVACQRMIPFIAQNSILSSAEVSAHQGSDHTQKRSILT